MNTPIVDFVKDYAQSDMTRFHMPGHKGVSFLGCESLDITEINGADELYVSQGIILESEQNAASLFDAARTLYSAGGSTQSIQAMLFSAYMRAKNGKDRPFVIAGRNAHKAFHYAAAKLGFDVCWLYPEHSGSICSCVITPDMLEDALKSCGNLPFAVYVTSPDYLGGMTDIAALSTVCRAYNVPLLVDNAHGAYLAFCEKNLHPLSQGADMCCDSAHKTLPVLTGGGYLHVSKEDCFGFSESIQRAMAVFGSTSPSYLILQSLDLCNRYLSEKIHTDMKICTQRVARVRESMARHGIADASHEPLKIATDFRALAVEGYDSPAQYFWDKGIQPEYADDDFVVFMVSPFNSESDFERLESAFAEIRLKKAKNTSVSFIKAEQSLSIRQAIFSPGEEIDIIAAEGRICAAPTVSCPPAIPIVSCGETVSREHIKLLQYYGVKKIAVIKP